MRAAGGKAGGDVRSWTGGDQRRSRKSVHADGLVIAGLTLPTGSWGHVSARLAATAARADASRMSDLCMVLQRQARDESPWVRPCRERGGDWHWSFPQHVDLFFERSVNSQDTGKVLNKKCYNLDLSRVS